MLVLFVLRGHVGAGGCGVPRIGRSVDLLLRSQFTAPFPLTFSPFITSARGIVQVRFSAQVKAIRHTTRSLDSHVRDGYASPFRCWACPVCGCSPLTFSNKS